MQVGHIMVNSTYARRLRTAARDDFSKFWTAHRYWVTFVSFLLAPMMFQLTTTGWEKMRPLDIVESAGIGIVLSVIGNSLIALFKGAESLDSDLHGEIQKRDGMIAEYERSLQKPQRTPAENHKYNSARLALERLGPSAVNALRHLSIHRELIFSLTHPPLPEGMDLGEAMNFYISCVREGLVSRHDINADINTECPSMIFEIAPGMISILEELLYA